MGTIANLVVGVRARTEQFNRKIKQAKSRLRKASKAMSRAGRTLTRNVTVPIAAAGGAASTFAANFQKSMSQTQAAIGGTGDQMESINKTVRDVAVATGKSFDQIFEATRLAQSSALDMAEANELVETTARASAAGMGEMRELVNFGTTAMLKFGDEIDSSAESMDILIESAQQTQATVSQFIPQFMRSMAAVDQLNISMREGASMFAGLADAARNTRAAGTQFTSVMKKLLKPSDSLRKLIESTFGSMKKFRRELGQNSIVTMQRLGEAVRSSDKNLAQLFKRKRAIAGASNLFADNMSKSTDVLSAQTEQVESVNEAFEESANFIRTLKRVYAKLKDTLIPVGETINKMVRPGLEKLIPLMERAKQSFNNLPASVKKTTIAVSAAAAAIGPLLIALSFVPSIMATVVGGFGVLTSFLFSTWGVAFAAAGAAVWAFAANWQAIKNFFKGVDFEGTLQAIVTWLRGTYIPAFNSTMESIKNTAKRQWELLVSFFSNNSQLFLRQFELIKSWFNNTFMPFWGNLWRGTKRVAKRQWKQLVSFWNNNVPTARRGWKLLKNWFMNSFLPSWSAIWRATKNLFKSQWNQLTTFWNKQMPAWLQTWNGVKSHLFGVVIPFWKNFWDDLVSMAKTAWNKISDIINKAMERAQPSEDFLPDRSFLDDAKSMVNLVTSAGLEAATLGNMDTISFNPESSDIATATDEMLGNRISSMLGNPENIRGRDIAKALDPGRTIHLSDMLNTILRATSSNPTEKFQGPTDTGSGLFQDQTGTGLFKNDRNPGLGNPSNSTQNNRNGSGNDPDEVSINLNFNAEEPLDKQVAEKIKKGGETKRELMRLMNA